MGISKVCHKCYWDTLISCVKAREYIQKRAHRVSGLNSRYQISQYRLVFSIVEEPCKLESHRYHWVSSGLEYQLCMQIQNLQLYIVHASITHLQALYHDECNLYLPRLQTLIGYLQTPLQIKLLWTYGLLITSLDLSRKFLKLYMWSDGRSDGRSSLQYALSWHLMW